LLRRFASLYPPSWATSGEILIPEYNNIQSLDMDIEEYIKAGHLHEAIACAQDAVRKSPAEARPVFCCSSCCVLGQWERALTQLNVVRDMAPRLHGFGGEISAGVAV